MKEYIVRAFAEETIKSFDEHNAPELVRCKDCKFAFQHWNNFYRCDNFSESANGYGNHSGDWFCADGER